MIRKNRKRSTQSPERFLKFVSAKQNIVQHELLQLVGEPAVRWIPSSITTSNLIPSHNIFHSFIHVIPVLLILLWTSQTCRVYNFGSTQGGAAGSPAKNKVWKWSRSIGWGGRVVMTRSASLSNLSRLAFYRQDALLTSVARQQCCCEELTKIDFCLDQHHQYYTATLIHGAHGRSAIKRTIKHLNSCDTCI